MSLGKRIAHHRRRLGLTQDALAEQLGITAQAISKWENDQSCPDITMLPRLAEIFGITTDELLGHDTPRQAVEAEPVCQPEDDEPGINVSNGDWSMKLSSGRWGTLSFAVYVLWVGGVMLAARLMEWDISLWNIAWPSAFFIGGLFALIRRFSFMHIGCTLIGAYFLVEKLNIWNFTVKSGVLFPALLVLFGLSLLVDALRKPKRPKIHFHHNGSKDHHATHEFTSDEDGFNCVVSFGSKTCPILDEEFIGGNACVHFGEVTVDLSACRTAVPGCTVNATCSFGELELIVPKHLKVECSAAESFGSVSVVGHPDPEPVAEIYLAATVSFGEITVRYI